MSVVPTTASKIDLFDMVELTKPFEHIPAGARGGVLEMRGKDVAMVEIMEPRFEGVDRIVFVPLAQLRGAA